VNFGCLNGREEWKLARRAEEIAGEILYFFSLSSVPLRALFNYGKKLIASLN
jgi:hypothetical protein